MASGPSSRQLVWLPGPEGGTWDFLQVLRPLILASAILKLEAEQAHTIPGPVEILIDHIRDVGERFGDALTRHLPGVTSATMHVFDAGTDPWERFVDALLEGTHVVVGKGLRQEGRPLADEDMPSITSLGGGARRAAALAALELYRNPDLWPPDRSAILLIEEPEVGLHPAAQRQIAQALRSLPAYGLQVVMVTHSPILIDAVAPSDLRLVAAEPSIHVAEGGKRWYYTQHAVRRPGALADVAEELGTRPSDVLLAKAFLIVEGKIDVAVISMWASIIGLDLAGARLQLIPSHGHSKRSS